MEMTKFFEANKVLNSIRAVEGAERLKEKIDSNNLMMDILPNSYEKFSGTLETKDYVSYCEFLKSHNGRLVLDMLEEDNGETYAE